MALNEKPFLQRVGLFVWLLLAVVVLVAHGPWEGYRVPTDYGAFYDWGEPPVSDNYEFWTWVSKAPLHAWFGSIGHALFALVAISVVMGAWLHLFAPPRPLKELPSSEPPPA